MNNYEAELIRLIDFVRPLQSKLGVLHMATENKFIVDKMLAEVSLQKKMNYTIEVVNRRRNILYTVFGKIPMISFKQ